MPTKPRSSSSVRPIRRLVLASAASAIAALFVSACGRAKTSTTSTVTDAPGSSSSTDALPVDEEVQEFVERAEVLGQSILGDYAISSLDNPNGAHGIGRFEYAWNGTEDSIEGMHGDLMLVSPHSRSSDLKEGNFRCVIVRYKGLPFLDDDSRLLRDEILNALGRSSFPVSISTATFGDESSPAPDVDVVNLGHAVMVFSSDNPLFPPTFREALEMVSAVKFDDAFKRS